MTSFCFSGKAVVYLLFCCYRPCVATKSKNKSSLCSCYGWLKLEAFASRSSISWLHSLYLHTSFCLCVYRLYIIHTLKERENCTVVLWQHFNILKECHATFFFSLRGGKWSSNIGSTVGNLLCLSLYTQRLPGFAVEERVLGSVNYFPSKKSK